MLSAAVTALGCLAEPEGIVITVSSDLAVPEDLDTLVFRVTDDDGSLLLDERIPLRESGVVWPATIGLRPARHARTRVTIEALGLIANKRVVSQKVSKTFVPGVVREAEIILSRRCRGWLCGNGQTCDSGQCVDVASRLPPPDDGPTCNCDSYFPFCVGASWTYQVYLPPAISTIKTWNITGSNDQTDVACGIAHERLFLLQLTVPGNSSWKWLQVERVDDGQRLWWRKDEWFDPVGERQSTTCYRPRKLRLDDTRRQVDEARPPLLYSSTVTEIPPFGDRVTVENHRDTWSVVGADEVMRNAPGGRSRFPVERLTDADVLCQHRIDLSENADTAAPNMDEQYFCFARGIGKIYEADIGKNLQEVLQSQNLPGCSNHARSPAP